MNYIDWHTGVLKYYFLQEMWLLVSEKLNCYSINHQLKLNFSFKKYLTKSLTALKPKKNYYAHHWD